MENELRKQIIKLINEIENEDTLSFILEIVKRLKD